MIRALASTGIQSVTESVQLAVARQPIVSRSSRVVGYELLYRSSDESVGANGATDEEMTADVLVHGVAGIGLDVLTRGYPAFVNVGRESLVEAAPPPLPPEALVLEIVDRVPRSDPEVLDACRRLADEGYRLALDDPDPAPDDPGVLEPLLERASIVKIDVLGRDDGEVRRRIDAFRNHGVRLVAQRVETWDEQEKWAEAGVELFQGNFYQKPETLSDEGVPVQRFRLMQLLNMLRDDSVPDEEVERVFRSDPTLSYRLLRIANSAAMGAGRIGSIGHAIRVIGRRRLHRWLSLIMLSNMSEEGNLDRELVAASVTRGRFLELIGERAERVDDAGRLFLVGLLSLLEPLTQRPLAVLLERLDLEESVETALIERAGPLAPFLDFVEEYERNGDGDWRATERAEAIGPGAAEAPALYMDAMDWANECLEGAAGYA